MEPLPKTVWQRLKAALPVGEHPDPDVLTALIESSLPGRERERVLEHVARCPDCREILAVATPAPAAAPVSSRARERWSVAWLGWPALRWGALAACFVVVGAAVLLRHNARPAAPAIELQEEMRVRDQRSTVTAPQELPAPGHQAKAPAGQPQAAQEDKQLQGPSGFARTARVAIPQSSAGARAPTPQPGQTQTNEVAVTSNPAKEVDQTASVEVQPESAQVEAGSSPAAAPPSPALGGTLMRRQLPGKAKASPMLAQAANPAVAKVQNSLPRTNLSVNSPESGALIPLWTISPEGQLERSFDSGKTWEPVVIIDSATLGPASNQSTSRYAWAGQSEKSRASLVLTPAPGQPKLQALSANGNDVWVGGAAGVLYHSADAGSHWIRVKPVAGAQTLTSDIIALDFADPQHGKLTTSAGELWRTADGGSTWQKQ